MRSALSMGADFAFTIGRRYRRQSGDTANSAAHIPIYHYLTINDLVKHLPLGCQLIGIELAPNAYQLTNYVHPERACYLLGAEDHGLTKQVLSQCHHIITIPGATNCLNVSVAGSIVLYDRISKKRN